LLGLGEGVHRFRDVWFRLVAGGGGGEASSERSRGCRGVVERGDEEMVAGNGHGWSEGLEAEQRRHGIGMGGGAAALGLGGLSVVVPSKSLRRFARISN
jgi:hypothetical protein